MDYTTIINSIFNYASVFMFIMAALVFVTNIVVEVIKRLLPVPTDIVVFIVAIAITVLALFIAAAVLNITVMWYYAVGAVVMGIFVAYGAMFGFDKFTNAWEKLKEYKN